MQQPVIPLNEPERLQALTATRKTGGTGLGLAICKEIIEKMQGKIGFQSQLGQVQPFILNCRL